MIVNSSLDLSKVVPNLGTYNVVNTDFSDANPLDYLWMNCILIFIN